jgi:hypothetical protein
MSTMTGSSSSPTWTPSPDGCGYTDDELTDFAIQCTALFCAAEDDLECNFVNTGFTDGWKQHPLSGMLKLPSLQ